MGAPDISWRDFRGVRESTKPHAAAVTSKRGSSRVYYRVISQGLIRIRP